MHAGASFVAWYGSGQGAVASSEGANRLGTVAYRMPRKASTVSWAGSTPSDAEESSRTPQIVPSRASAHAPLPQ